MGGRSVKSQDADYRLDAFVVRASCDAPVRVVRTSECGNYLEQPSLRGVSRLTFDG
jgi:hypothetical protein